MKELEKWNLFARSGDRISHNEFTSTNANRNIHTSRSLTFGYSLDDSGSRLYLFADLEMQCIRSGGTLVTDRSESLPQQG